MFGEMLRLWRSQAGRTGFDSELFIAKSPSMRRRSIAFVLLSELRPEHTNKPLEYTTDEAPGALRNGARVRKTVFALGDTHAVGDCATVVGSILRPDHPARYGYFVVWDDTPDVPVFIVADRVAAL